MQSYTYLPQVGWIGASISIAISFFEIIRQYYNANSIDDNIPYIKKISKDADISEPDFSTRLRSINQARDALRTVFEMVPPQFFPIVIFVDDLDRCSPNKIAEVARAINLAEEFENCIFVVEMDPVRVAKALQQIHNQTTTAIYTERGDELVRTSSPSQSKGR